MTFPLLINCLFDVMLALLLAATIAGCAMLSKRIKMMQDNQGLMEETIQQFDAAVARAAQAVAELQKAAEVTHKGLDAKIEKANFLADDLAFMIEKSAKIIGQMGGAPGAGAAHAAIPAAAPASETPRLSAASAASLGAALKRLETLATPAAKPARPARTRAERELIDALAGV